MPCLESTLPSVESQEKWKVIADFPEYEVSSHGRVRRCVARKHYSAGRLLSPGNVKGYRKVQLSHNGVSRQIGVHRLVAFAFLPKSDESLIEVNHKDGDKSHNHVSNLEWVTHVQNQRHSMEILGNNKSGSEHFAALFTKEQVVEIHKMRMNCISTKEIAEHFQTHHTVISGILLGRTYKEELEGLSREYPPINYPSRYVPPPKKGEDHPNSKLTATDVIQIKRRFQEGAILRELVNEFKVHISTLSRIRRGEIWQHVTLPDVSEPSDRLHS